MRIGLINELHGRPGTATPHPTWESTLERAKLAEEVGFDIFVFEDALLYAGGESGEPSGVWESMPIAAALAATTSTIRISQSVINSPYRSPAMTASTASTIDEISGGRYTLGIGAGNTADSDYKAFGFPIDHRYSRFAEAIQIIHELLKTGHCDFSGTYYTVEDSRLVLRGPTPTGPPINIAAGGPKMLGLTAAYGDEWNWWGYDETLDELRTRMEPILTTLDEELAARDRDPADLIRTIDLYSIVPPGVEVETGRDKVLRGSADEIATYILALADLGVEEVRVDLLPHAAPSIEAMAPVVDLVHAG